MSPHTRTPTLGVVDPRGLSVRVIGYCRDTASGPAEPRVQRQSFDHVGRVTAQRDARLAADAPPNLRNTFGLSGHPLLTESVDAGWRLELSAEHGQKVQG